MQVRVLNKIFCRSVGCEWSVEFPLELEIDENMTPEQQERRARLASNLAVNQICEAHRKATHPETDPRSAILQSQET